VTRISVAIIFSPVTSLTFTGTATSVAFGDVVSPVGIDTVTTARATQGTDRKIINIVIIILDFISILGGQAKENED